MIEKLPPDMVHSRLQAIHADWSLNPATDHIVRSFSFDNFYQTMAFANAVARVAHQYDHHPDLHIYYKTCRVDYSTHSTMGLSELDFICARDIDHLIKT